MSAFFQENQHFISIKLNKEMRGLTEVERTSHYERHLKQESRTRFKTHYNKLTDAKEKRNFYSDAIDYFRDFEFKYLIYSIYFDSDAEIILKDLGQRIARKVPANYKDDFHLLELMHKSDTPNFIDNYILDLFRNILGLNITSSTSKNESSNPEANKLSEWLFSSLRSPKSYSEVILLLFHFIKYWNQTYYIQFTRYKNYNKSVVLLTKIINSYKSLSTNNIKLNLFQAVDTIRKETADLICSPINTPYIDSVEKAIARDRSVMTGYLVKLKEFEQLLMQNKMLFKDLSNLSLKDLFLNHCSCATEFKHLYSDSVRQRVKNGILPTREEIAYFSERTNFEQYIENKKNTSLYQYIIRTNYIFFLLDTPKRTGFPIK